MGEKHRKATEDALISAMKGQKNVIAFVQLQPDGRTRIIVRKLTESQRMAGMGGVLKQTVLEIPTLD